MPKWYGESALNPDRLIPSDEQWQLQWQRVIRWFHRSEEIKKKSEVTELDSYDIDVLIAFFQNCYHLRDWIGASRPKLRGKLDNLFKHNFEMGACRDICNGYKHKKLNRPSYDADFNLYREYDHFQTSGNPVIHRVAFTDDIKKYDLFDLVERCFHLWENFIFNEVDVKASSK